MSTSPPHEPGPDEGAETSGTTPPPGTDDGAGRLDRRRFLAWTATGVAAVAGAAGAVGAVATGPTTGAARRPRPRSRRPRPDRTAATVDGFTDDLRAPAVVAENLRPGDAWWVTSPQRPGAIEGFADRVSAQRGEVVTLFTSTDADAYRVEAYRMGWYGGAGARRVWTSAAQAGHRQGGPVLDAATRTVSCPWWPTVAVPVDERWPPGAYLLKLVGTGGEQQFVPLCVRDDTSTSAFVLQQSVTTWQAYNRWGGFSLYYGNPDGRFSYVHAPDGGATYAARARVVSFDRPYDHDWASGAADFVGNELPMVALCERAGLDVTYWTDLDLHARPWLLANHRALLSLGHDEYWSTPMRDGAEQALASGVNLAVFGANACYRQIRVEPSPVGPDRRVVCYKSADEDPMARFDPALVTVDWQAPPVDRPEASLLGVTYQDVDAQADLVVADPGSWIVAGAGLGAGARLHGAIVGEFDRYVPDGAGPADVDVVAHSPVPNRRGNYSDVTWYTVPTGGGVFCSGTASWVGQLADLPLVPPNVLPGPLPGTTAALTAMTRNVLAVVGTGPGSVTHPSSGTWRRAYAAGAPVPGGVDSVTA